jgi:glutamyl/glutaminyl-tRNA synthetase
MIKEIRIDDEERKIPREIVIKATIDKLLDLLVDENQLIDESNFVEDFLLTYRTFINDPLIITNKLLEYFNKNINSISSEHIARVILSWVNNHYNDFESNTKLNEFLEKFDDYLQHHESEVETKKKNFIYLFIVYLVYEIMEIFT